MGILARGTGRTEQMANTTTRPSARHGPMAWPISTNGLARRADDARPRLDPHIGEPFVGGHA